MPSPYNNTASIATRQIQQDRDIDRQLAKALVEREVLTLQQAKAALAQLKNGERGKSLEEVLIASNTVKEEDILETKATLWHVPYIDLKNYEIDPEVVELIPGPVARQFRFFPLFRIDGTLLLAMCDPKDIKAIDKATQVTHLEISPALTSQSALDEALDKYYQKTSEPLTQMSNEEMQDILEVIESEETKVVDQTEATAADLMRQAEDAPVVKMANMILIQAITEGASDIHFNPEENELRIRFRVDGVLHDSFHLPRNLQDALISRIKILSNLDIAEHRVPQDGKLRLRLTDGREIDIRVSTLPSAYGENLVLRVLDKSAALMKLGNLGFEDDVLATFEGLLAASYGIILVTGPTGSGKTTTLYAALNGLSTVVKNIITLEDPIEYKLPLIRQSQVNEKAGMTFAKGLRAILRQDPDIVLVGEIRDTETAAIAIQAALTGHLVLSTLHTNSAAVAVTRLADMNIEPFLISTALLGVQAQRLVRKICPECREEFKPDYSFLKLDFLKPYGIDLQANEVKFYRGRGCKKCKGSGYKGRMSIIEVFAMNERLRSIVLKGGSADDLARAAIEDGMRPLAVDGWIKVLKGLTTVDEVMRVTNAS
jgi:type IV pilus assembly protein PilB